VAGEASGAAVAEADLMDDEVEPVDELAIDAARDYCETCGRFTDGETCPACGDES
jgi:recombinational DNA repair protein RecR